MVKVWAVTNASCPLNSNHENDKKMANYLVKNEKKKKEENVPQKMPKKHYESQVKNKIVSTIRDTCILHNK